MKLPFLKIVHKFAEHLADNAPIALIEALSDGKLSDADIKDLAEVIAQAAVSATLDAYKEANNLDGEALPSLDVNVTNLND